MELRMDIGSLVKAVNGRLIRGSVAARFDSFVTDTRRLKSGDIFWALRGLEHDAHVFLEDTLEKKAGGWVAEDAKIGRFRDFPETVVGVWDTLKALQRLSAWHRARFDIPLAAITGSNGKSTVKEMLKSIFSRAGATCSNAGNLNNQFGLPLSLLELKKEHKYAVFELGASKKGDIAEIASLARPTVAVITNIGPAHLQFFGDLETVFRTKTEIIDCLAPGGTLVYNADDRRLEVLKGRKLKKIGFGRGGRADLKVGEKRGALVLDWKGKSVAVKLPAAAKHDPMNAAAAAGAALASGLGLRAVKAGLETFTPPPMRMQRLKIRGSTVILDAYNANPVSMNSALDSLAASFPKPWYLALGDMKELGKHSAGYHAELGRRLAGFGAEKIFLAGPEMKAAAAELAGSPTPAAYAPGAESWASELRRLVSAGKGTFLLKASRAMKFEKLIEGLADAKQEP